MAKKTRSEAADHADRLVEQATGGGPSAESLTSAIEEVDKEVVGRSPTSTAVESPNARDFMPGMISRKDPTYLPDRVYDEQEDQVRRCALKGEYHYVWVTAGIGGHINRFKNMGYRLALYSGGAGLAEGGFMHTGMFEQTPQNYVANGDTWLMYCPIRLFEAFQQEDREMVQKHMLAATEDFHNRAYGMGVRSFEERTNPNEPGAPAELVHN